MTRAHETTHSNIHRLLEESCRSRDEDLEMAQVDKGSWRHSWSHKVLPQWPACVSVRVVSAQTLGMCSGRPDVPGA